MEDSNSVPQVFTTHHPSHTQQVHTQPTHAGTPPILHGDRQLPVFCPQCGNRIEIHKGLCGNRLIDAIMLQAERIGTELECQRCDTRFVFQKLEAIQHRKKLRTRRLKPVHSR